jgi:hypothetical protein
VKGKVTALGLTWAKQGESLPFPNASLGAGAATAHREGTLAVWWLSKTGVQKGHLYLCSAGCPTGGGGRARFPGQYRPDQMEPIREEVETRRRLLEG